LNPVLRRTPTPEEEGTTAPTPGTSGSNVAVEKYRAAEKAMVLGPGGRFIPRIILKRDDGDQKEQERTHDPQKYKYIL